MTMIRAELTFDPQFATFSKHYDHGTLDFDQDFRKSYLAMLKHCQKGSLTDQPNLSKRNR